ncbi:MAG: hypothetical protein AB1Z98_06310 [Nannocystaceae bacterium]
MLRGWTGVAACVMVAGCVEIDPSYGESFSAGAGSSTSSGSGSNPATGSSSGSDDQSSGSGVLTCDCGPWELCEAGVCTMPARILFVNLEGVTTTFGGADASMDRQNLSELLEGSWAGYSDDATERQALLDIIAAQWEPFRVVVTDQRPDAAAAPYLMAVVTADPPPPEFGGTPWFAFPDCNDLIERDVAFVFMAPGNGLGTQTHADYTSQAITRTFGLLLTSSGDDITGFGSQFVDACVPLDEPACAEHVQAFCDGDPDQQNSFRELEALLGLRG